MESIDPVSDLREHERATTLPWTEYPPTPAWYFPLVGGWTSALLASVLYLRETPWMAVALVLLVGSEAAFLGWYRRWRGSMPSFARIPQEFRPAVARYVVGVALVAAVVGVFAAVAPPPVAIAVCFLLVTAGLVAYERAYARAAAATRARVA